MPNPKNIRNFESVLRATGFSFKNGKRQFGIKVINKSGSDIAADALVAISGFDVTSKKLKIVLADADAADLATDVYVSLSVIKNGNQGNVYKGGLSNATLNTNAVTSAGDPVYLDTTAGGFTATAPSTPASRVVVAGYAVVKSATVGQIVWDIKGESKFGSNDLQSSFVATVTGTIATADITGTAAGQFGHANGYILVPAPGAGKSLVLESAVASYVFGVAAYTGGGNTTVNIGAGGAAVTGLVSAANFAAAASSKPVAFYPLATAGVALTANTPLNLVTASAFTQPGTAAGVINYAVQYAIVTL